MRIQANGWVNKAQCPRPSTAHKQENNHRCQETHAKSRWPGPAQSFGRHSREILAAEWAATPDWVPDWLHGSSADNESATAAVCDRDTHTQVWQQGDILKA